jgi:hypothetical protein
MNRKNLSRGDAEFAEGENNSAPLREPERIQPGGDAR